MLELTRRSRTAAEPLGGTRSDVAAVAAGICLVALAVVVGVVLLHHGVLLATGSPPLVGRWLPHLGVGTPLTVVVAACVVGCGPMVARTWRWSHLLVGGYLVSVAWTFGLALVDGWRRGVTGRLSIANEYLPQVHRVTDVGATVRTFAAHILKTAPDPWTTQVAGHPPGALLAFVGLDRIGLGGGIWAGVVCVLVGATVTVSVPVTLRALGAPSAGRAALPFLVLFPGAVWIGVSADGLFAGVVTAGVALLAVGATTRGRRADAASLAGGVLLGGGLFLSYGLVLMALPVVAVAALTRRWRALFLGAVGVAAVFFAFAGSGFWWMEGYHLTVARYGDGVAAGRPYYYWVWANLAAAVVVVGPATVAGLRRAVAERWDFRGIGEPRTRPVLLLVAAAAAAILLADLSGLSKAEVERIWLPFTVWLCAAGALLPVRASRGWLFAQAVTAIAVNHLLLTNW